MKMPFACRTRPFRFVSDIDIHIPSTTIQYLISCMIFDFTETSRGNSKTLEFFTAFTIGTFVPHTFLVNPISDYKCHIYIRDSCF